MVFTAITKEQYNDLFQTRCIVKGRVEAKLSKTIVAVKLAKEYSAINCKTVYEAKRLFHKVLNDFNKKD